MRECLDLFEDTFRIIENVCNFLSTPLLAKVFVVSPGTVCLMMLFGSVPFSAFYTIYYYDPSVGLITLIAMGIWIQVG